MKKVTLAIAMAALVMFAGCKKDKETTGTTLKASIEQCNNDGSKTSVVPVGANQAEIHWTAGDKIVVNNGTTSGTFTLTNGQGTKDGTFTYAGEYTFGANNIAVYPETATISGTTVTINLPAEQNYVAEKNGANPMLGKFTNSENLTFTSLCGVLGISLKAESADVDITAIEVVSKTDEKLNGMFTVDANATDDNLKLVKSGTDGTNSVRYNFTTTTTLTSAEAQNFYFALPVGALASGFTLKVYNGGTTPILTTGTDHNISIVLNQVNQMSTVEVAAGIATWNGNLSTLTGSDPADYAIATDGMTIYGTLAANVKVSIAAGATVTLDGVTINGVDNLSYQWAGITCEGNATINLLGTNIVKGFAPSYPGVFIPKNYTLTIDGTGSLNASSNGNAAGIGGDYSGYCGNITINGGVITATGGPNAAGIGGAFDCECGDILIQGGTVTATAGKNAAGIGCGGGEDATCGNITIENTVTLVTAVRGNGATYSIGEGKDGMCGTVTIGGTNYGSGATPNQTDGLTFVYPAPAPTLPEGAIDGKFTIDATGKQVYFAQGNLQYLGSSWKFADNQWEYFGNTQSDGHRDLFGWGTKTTPDNISNSGYSWAEWGENAITNGGNAENSGWYTMTRPEWQYLFKTRTDASQKYGFATITIGSDSYIGFVILPDTWTLPSGCSFTPATHYTSEDGGWGSAADNTYDAAQWSDMESAGAVFLPASGSRNQKDNNTVSNAGASGFYWTQTSNGYGANVVYFDNEYFSYSSGYTYMRGYSVRLVKDAN